MTTERQLTEWFRELYGCDPRRVLVGIGDDAAVVRSPGDRLVLTCDPVVAGVHFEPGTPARRVAHKAVHRNLSDLAAMGAVPDHLLVSVLLPGSATARWRRSLFVALRDVAAAAGCSVVGGDVGGTPGPLTVTITAIGHLEGRPLTRAGARIGDSIHVTGPLGGSRLGHHLRFHARLAEGRWLARQSTVTAAIDISDGLALDLWTLLRASGVPGAVLDERSLPCTTAATRAARTSGRTALQHALHDGEDHELLFTVTPPRPLPRGGPLLAAARTAIGHCTSRPGLWLRTPDDRARPLHPTGWQFTT